MKSKHKIRGLLCLWLLASLFCLWGARIGLEHWHYATSDSISRSEIDTRRILSRYGSTGDVKEIRNWILNGPTEANGTAMCLTLGDWGIEHRQQFVEILGSLSHQQKNEFIEQFSASLNQDNPKEFEIAFENSHYPAITKILETLSENEPIAWREQ